MQRVCHLNESRRRLSAAVFHSIVLAGVSQRLAASRGPFSATTRERSGLAYASLFTVLVVAAPARHRDQSVTARQAGVIA
jgi:hypothetical protein